VKRIDVDLVELELHFDDVVARQADAEGGESEFGRDVQEDDRQGDRDPKAAVDHFVEMGIARIVVTVRVAAIAIDIEHLRVQMPEAKDRRLPRQTTLLDARRQSVQLVDVALHVEARILLERNQQRPTREVVIRDLARGVLSKTSPGFGGMDEHGLVRSVS